MTDAELDALERAARAATPGPWEINEGPVFSQIFAKGINIALIGTQHEDAAYIVAAYPAAVLELIAELRQARDYIRAFVEFHQKEATSCQK